MFSLVLYPPSSFEAVYYYICDRRGVAVARYRMINLSCSSSNCWWRFEIHCVHLDVDQLYRLTLFFTLASFLLLKLMMENNCPFAKFRTWGSPCWLIYVIQLWHHKYATIWHYNVIMKRCDSEPFPKCAYTLNKSSKWYIVRICRVFQEGLIADEFYPYSDLKYIIKTNNFVFVHLKSSFQYQFTRKTMASKAKWRLKPE